MSECALDKLLQPLGLCGWCEMHQRLDGDCLRARIAELEGFLRVEADAAKALMDETKRLEAKLKDAEARLRWIADHEPETHELLDTIKRLESENADMKKAFEAACDAAELKAIDACPEPPLLEDSKEVARTKAYWDGYFHGAMDVKYRVLPGPTSTTEASRADARCKNCGGIGTLQTLDSAGRGPCPRCVGSGKEPNEKGEHAQEGG